MGETALKSHAEGKKHVSSVKVCQRTVSVSDFFKKKEVSIEKCSSEKRWGTSSGLACTERQNKNQVS